MIFSIFNVTAVIYIYGVDHYLTLLRRRVVSLDFRLLSFAGEGQDFT